MRNVFKQSFLFLLCVAASASARTTAPLVLDPDEGQHLDAHVTRLHERLLAAAETDDLESVKELLAMGADINVIEEKGKGYTPLTLAAENGHAAMTRFLLAHGADPNGKGVNLTPLFWTVSNGQTRCVRILLQYGANPYRYVDEAASDGQVDIAKLLIWRMPQLPCSEARKLLGQAWSVALSKAAAAGSMRRVRAAVVAGAKVNNLYASDDDGIGSPLMRATARGSLPIMKFLFAHKAQVNLRDNEGRTALMYLGEADHSRILMAPLTSESPTSAVLISASPASQASLNAKAGRLLLRHGAGIELRDHSGLTALMYAAQGNWRATALLLAHGARINARDKDGLTALHWAATLRDPKALKVLLRHGASINTQDKQGETALMLASVNPDTPANARQRADRRDCLKLLIRSGANSHLKDKRGKTSSDYSRMHDEDFVTAS